MGDTWNVVLWLMDGKKSADGLPCVAVGACAMFPRADGAILAPRRDRIAARLGAFALRGAVQRSMMKTDSTVVPGLRFGLVLWVAGILGVVAITSMALPQRN